MRQQSSLLRLVVSSAGLLMLIAAVSAETSAQGPCPSPTAIPSPSPASSPTFRLHIAGGELGTGSPAPTKNLPVLFVHGHNLDSDDDPPGYTTNWQLPLRVFGFADLPSFKDALRLPSNDSLGIEEYYIQFLNQERSIAQDAADIGSAIEIILHRHDSGYPVRPTTNVQVVIIAYSKGTISARLYLKNLDAENRSFRPVSEFIAISPPNHGINSSTDAGSSTAGEQLRNGYDEACNSFGHDDSVEFFTNLNGHSICDTKFDPNNPNATPVAHDEEAPDSRPATGRPTEGVLYVTLFAANNRDFVGGGSIVGPENADCQGRRLALNLSSNAVNLSVEVASIIAATIPAFVHQRTVHTPDVICKALYTAVHHRPPPQGLVCSTENVNVPGFPEAVSVPIIPAPTRAAAMLTLDFSGSMSISTGPGATRATVLKEAVELFVELWSAVSVPSDRLGVTYFRTDVTGGETPRLLRDPNNPASNPARDLIDEVNSQQPSDGTAMGGGLQRSIEAFEGLTDNTPIRRVILFTDGMQNVNPMVERNLNNLLAITNVTGRVDSNVSPDVNPNDPIILNSSLGISIDTIGIGAGGTFLARLEQIATATNGHTRTTLDIDLLRRFFVEALINALKGFSPQLVAYRRGTVATRGGSEAFAIEDGVRKLVLKVSWKRGDALAFTVNRNGVDVTSAGRFINGDFYKIFVIDFPAKGPIAARGNWQVQINGNAGTAYEAAAIVDGSPITYDSTFDLKQPRAGEPLDLVVRLTAGGQPIGGTAKVFVTLMSPTITAGDIIIKYPAKNLPTFEPGMSMAERQLLALAQDPKRSALLKPKTQTLILEPAGNGEFRARLSTQVPGIYTAFVTIEGSDARLGQFSRTMTMTTEVRFANADRKASDIFVSECDSVAGRRYVRIFLSPRDANGHFMGPGSPSEISLELSDGRLVGSARDLGDGSYALLLEVPLGGDPIATLKIAGTSLFTGRLSQLSEKPRK